jgi:hypothetical protein
MVPAAASTYTVPLVSSVTGSLPAGDFTALTYANCIARSDPAGSSIPQRMTCYYSYDPDPQPPPPPPPYQPGDHYVVASALDVGTGSLAGAVLPCEELIPGFMAVGVGYVAQLPKGAGAASGSITLVADTTAPLDCADGTEVVGPLTLTPLAQSHDQDNDGCTDWEELGAAQGTGGLRDPFNFWDLYDVPAGSPLARDKVVAAADLGAVVARYGASGDPTVNPLSPPPPAPGYHPAYDRAGSLGPSQWNLAPADGVISGGDLGGVTAQYGHSCAAAP